MAVPDVANVRAWVRIPSASPFWESMGIDSSFFAALREFFAPAVKEMLERVTLIDLLETKEKGIVDNEVSVLERYSRPASQSKSAGWRCVDSRGRRYSLRRVGRN